ncbi:MAG: hypothetical protein ABII25_00070 [bacterium]
MPDIFNDFINKLSQLQKASLEKKELKITGFHGSSPAYFFSQLAQRLPAGFKKPVVFIFSQPEEAENFYLDFITFCGKNEIFFSPIGKFCLLRICPRIRILSAGAFPLFQKYWTMKPIF